MLCNVEACCVVIDPNYESKLSEITAILRYKLYFLHSWKVQMALAIPVQFIFGRKFYKNALLSVLNKKPGMDLLVSLGSISTFGYSIYCIYKYGGDFGRQLYFESGAMMISFILLGKYLEALAKRKTNNTLNSLKKIQMATAIVETNGEDKEVEIKDIKVNDIVRITPGKQIPLDGVVTEGESFVDESLITGESKAVPKKIGSRVFGGTINTYGSFKFKVEKTIEEGFLSDIISLVEEAQKSKPAIQKLADKICGMFVISIIAISIGTFLYGYLYRYHGSSYYIEKPIINAVSVLVISCPCALGIATPIAVTLGSGLAAKNGILIKRGAAIEESGKIDTVIFDKTGTLTKNELKVKKVVCFTEDYTEDYIVEIAGNVEKYSEHPIGRALYEEAKSRSFHEESIHSENKDLNKTYKENKNTMSNVDIQGKIKSLNKINVQNFKSTVGKGVTAFADNKEVIIGNKSFLKENNISVNEICDEIVVYISIDNNLAGAILFEDSIKEDAKEAIEKLKEDGIYTLLVSGDKKDVCERMAQSLGIDKVYSEVMPQDKYDIVKELQKSGRKVAMTGDGINDLIALSAADLSIAVKDGTDIAVENSDVIIMGRSLMQIPVMLQLSKKVMRKIKQNLLFAFIYNIVGIPIAASGLLKPEIACILMIASSLSVVLNTMTLKKMPFRKKAN